MRGPDTPQDPAPEARGRPKVPRQPPPPREGHARDSGAAAEPYAATEVNVLRRPMSQAADRVLGAAPNALGPERAFTPKDDERLLDALKRCSPATREAARQFRRTGSAECLPAIVDGILEHFVEPDLRSKLCRGADGLRLVEDLAIDSLTLLEVVYLAEDVLQISIENEDLRPFRTVGDIKEFLASKVQRECAPGLALAPGVRG